MKILVACEESQALTIELRKLGHEAYSCDIIDQSGGHPEWHIIGNVLPLLNGRCAFSTSDGAQHVITDRWDMIVAFPPCTKTSNAGARHLWKGGKLNIQRYYEGLCGKALFLAIWAADCDKVIIENPTPSKVFDYPPPTQVVQPYEYGHPFTKKNYVVGARRPTPGSHEHCRARENAVPVWLLLGETRGAAQGYVYNRSSEEPKQNLSRNCKSYGRAMGRVSKGGRFHCPSVRYADSL